MRVNDYKNANYSWAMKYGNRQKINFPHILFPVFVIRAIARVVFFSDSLLCFKFPGFCWYCSKCNKIKSQYIHMWEIQLKQSLFLFLKNLGLPLRIWKPILYQVLLISFLKLFQYFLLKESKSVVLIRPKNSEQPIEKTKSDLFKCLILLNSILNGLIWRIIMAYVSCNNVEDDDNFSMLANKSCQRSIMFQVQLVLIINWELWRIWAKMNCFQ